MTASTSKKQALAYAVAGAAAMGATTTTVEADFVGPYDHSNWTFSTSGSSDGSTITSTTNLTLTGSNNGFGGLAQYTIAAAASGTVSFNWSYSSGDTGNWDYGGFYLNGVFTTLANNASQGGGSFSTFVNSGDTIGFFVASADGAFGPGVLDVSNFVGPTAIPEPGTLGLLALGAVAGSLGFRRRR